MYFNPEIPDSEVGKVSSAAMKETSRFPAAAVRRELVARGQAPDRIVRYVYRPFDVRWFYWEPETKLVERKRSEFFPHAQIGNYWLSASQRHRREFSPPLVMSAIGSFHMFERATSLFPLYLAPEAIADSLFEGAEIGAVRANLSRMASEYLMAVGGEPEELFHHIVATVHSDAYRTENAGALRQDWPRIPLPKTGERLRASAQLGRSLAALLNPEAAVPGVTTGRLRPEVRAIAPITKVGGGQLDPEAGDLDVTARWGYTGARGVTMPGKGRAEGRPYTENERDAILSFDSLEDPLQSLGHTCVDVYLNDRAYWRSIPIRVWEYRLGGYQVIKKWLSYREKDLLGRALKPEEVREVTDMARRIAAILLMGGTLYVNYREVASACWSTIDPG